MYKNRTFKKFLFLSIISAQFHRTSWIFQKKFPRFSGITGRNSLQKSEFLVQTTNSLLKIVGGVFPKQWAFAKVNLTILWVIYKIFPAFRKFLWSCLEVVKARGVVLITIFMLTFGSSIVKLKFIVEYWSAFVECLSDQVQGKKPLFGLYESWFRVSWCYLWFDLGLTISICKCIFIPRAW